MMNAIVNPATFDRFKFELLSEPYLIIDGVLQNQDGVVSVMAGSVAALRAGAAPESHELGICLTQATPTGSMQTCSRNTPRT
jgi:error-prone DNA polymerase